MKEEKIDMQQLREVKKILNANAIKRDIMR